MNVRDLIPWNRGRDVTVRRGEEANPFLTLHREMNRAFDDVFRGFDPTSFRSDRVLTWPNIEVSETDEEAVVGKTARVREEVVVRKDVADRVETVRDTVRREDVEITKDDRGEANADRGIGAVPPVRR